MLLIPVCLFLFERLYFLLQLTDFLKQAVLVLLLHAGVFLELLGDPCDLVLQFLAGSLTVSNELLILCYVPLQVIEHLELLVEGDQGVKLVLQLDLLLLKR